eukprot:SAG11_NODE_9916_length_870_cov_1.198444_3_plen_126_part_01
MTNSMQLRPSLSIHRSDLLAHNFHDCLMHRSAPPAAPTCSPVLICVHITTTCLTCRVSRPKPQTPYCSHGKELIEAFQNGHCAQLTPYSRSCFPTLTFVLSPEIRLKLVPQNYMLPTGTGRTLYYC